MRRAAIWVLLILLAWPGGARAQGIRAGPAVLDFTGRAQLQLHTTSIGEAELGPERPVATLAFETRRVRFGVDLAFEEWITASIEAELAGAAPRLTDGFVDLALAESFALRAGQFKKPFGLFELTSNTTIPMVERAARLRGLGDYLATPAGDPHFLLAAGGYVGRDIGVMAHGAAGRIGYAAGIFNGSGPNAREQLGSKAVAARVTLLAAERLTLGAGVSRQPTALPGAGGEELVGTAWSVDASYGAFRAPGPRVMAELMRGDDPLLAAAGALPPMLGVHAAAGWFVPRTGRVEGLEPALRLAWGDPDRGRADDEGLLVTPGVNFYFTGRNRLMVNADFYLPAQDALEMQYGLVAQLQVHF